MPRIRPATWLCAALLLAGAMARCSARQIRNDQDLDTAARRAAAGEESGWKALENTVRAGSDGEDDYPKRALVAIGKIQSPRGEPILREHLNHRQLRGEAALGLAQQRTASNKDKIDADIVAATAQNAKEYGGLSREEIRALGETDHPDAVRLLKEQIGRDANKDELTIDALGKILKRKPRSQYRPGDLAQPIGANLSVETIMSSDEAKAKETDAASAGGDDAEKVLLDYLSGDGVPDTKDKACASIAGAHPPGTPYLLALAAKGSLPVTARIAIVDYLTRLAVNTKDRSMIQKFSTLRKRVGKGELAASIDLSLRVLGNAFGRAVAVGRVYRIVQSDGFEPLGKESDKITLKQKPYSAYSAADVKTNLKKALLHYQLDARLADRMQTHVSDLLNLPEKSQSSERNLIFSALGRLYPAQDFYVLKKQGQDAFAKPGYFTTTLRLITASARGRSWQIAALQRVWGLTYSEADTVRQIYLRDGKLLQQRMRL